MPRPTFRYSTHARWYVCICMTPTEPRRFAVVVQTPSHGDCYAMLADGLNPRERIEAAARVVTEFYDAEDWFRLPNEIRCAEPALTLELRRIFEQVPVRTDRASRLFPEIKARFLENAPD